MPELHDLVRDLTAELQTLRTLFTLSENGLAAAKWFDEFLSENELDLALHVVCDFLLEPATPPTSPELQARLEHLHSKMKIVDDCWIRLRQKSNSLRLS
jgi:hypothetical protein